MPHAAADPSEPSDVLGFIGRDADIIVPLANGEPPTLLDAIEAGAPALVGVRVHQMHALQERAYIRGEFGDRLRHVSYFLSDATRTAYWAGTVDLVPNHFSEVTAILQQTTRCSLVVARVAPLDRHGYFSLGTNADYTASLIGKVPFFVEADPHMPRTFGGNQIHHSQVVGWCRADRPLVEVAPRPPTADDLRIAELIADRIPNGATIQVGIGAIAGAVLGALREHSQLGIHTELISEGIADLVEAGVVTGTQKSVHRNKVVGTFALGTRRLYDWLDENAAVELLPVSWVNDPRVIAREPMFVSVNATTEVDLYGQCASETIGGQYWSSSGGQADFARGAMYSEHGTAFVALRSVTPDGRSRIRAHLTEGSVVTTLKNTVDHVVTEWGVAELRGKSLAKRARLLISIAHPSHRDELERTAHAHGLVRHGAGP